MCIPYCVNNACALRMVHVKSQQRTRLNYGNELTIYP